MMEKVKTCKICHLPFTQKDMDELYQHLEERKKIHPRHLSCYLQVRFDSMAIGIR